MAKNKLNKESFRLFFNKELKVILGKNAANWWVLFLMFFVTIVSISFSKSSLTYLASKMNDPFINWVNIQNRNDAPINRLISELSSTEKSKKISERYNIQNIEQNIYRNINFITSNNKIKPFEGRTVKPTSPILNRILNNDNLIQGRSFLTDSRSIGLIVTKDMLERMGYESTPLFIYLAYPFDLLKISLVSDLHLKTSFDYFGSPIPVIAVVKQLPGMMSFMCTEYFVQQKDNQENTFDLTKPEYLNSIEFASSNSFFTKVQLDSLLRSITNKYYRIEEVNETNSYKDYILLKVFFDQKDSISTKEIGTIVKEIEKYSEKSDVVRVYTYNTTGQKINISADYLSIDFQRLDSIQAFAKWANDETGVKVDMTLIDAKNNFNIISRLGLSLSLVIVIISIAFIIIFLINLFRGHFEKVKKNIGTFKAFGMSNESLIIVYMAVLSTMIFAALITAFLSSFFLEYVTAYFGLLNAEEPILNVLSDITLYSLLATIIIALIAIYITVNILLKSTPGDLIYERD